MSYEVVFMVNEAANYSEWMSAVWEAAAVGKKLERGRGHCLDVLLTHSGIHLCARGLEHS